MDDSCPRCERLDRDYQRLEGVVSALRQERDAAVDALRDAQLTIAGLEEDVRDLRGVVVGRRN